VDPDHSDGFGDLFRRDEESTPIDNVVTRSGIDQFFGVLAYRISSEEPLSKAEPEHQQSKDDSRHDDMPSGEA
jgi:hypothetical protein